MSKPSSYDLLKDINDSVFRLEMKLDKRMVLIEEDVEDLKSFKDNMLGKVAIITVIATSIISIIIAFFKELITKKI